MVMLSRMSDPHGPKYFQERLHCFQSILFLPAFFSSEEVGVCTSNRGRLDVMPQCSLAWTARALETGGRLAGATAVISRAYSR